MKELNIASFKYGLDSRREALTSLLGTLVTCENAHINPGGEVEKRKAFVDLGTINTITSPATNIDFYMVNDVGYVFYGQGVTFALNPGLPFTTVEVILVHPAVSLGATFDLTQHGFVSLSFARVFNGKHFVAALFADGNEFLYYDGVLVTQSSDGRVLFGRNSLANLSSDLAVRVAGLTAWYALANQDEDGAVQNGTTIVKSPIATYFTPVTEVESAAGLLGSNLIDSDVAFVAATNASASFQVTSFVGTYTLTAPANSDGSGTAALTGGPVTAITSTTVTAGLIVQAINDLTFIHGYTAIKNATDSVFVYAPAAWGSAANAFLLTVTEAGGGSSGGGGGVPTTLNATISPSPLVKDYVWNNSIGTFTARAIASITASGGTPGIDPAPPYSYLWSETSTGSGNGITPTTPTAQTTEFTKTGMLKSDTIIGSFKCVVTDTLSITVTIYLNVAFNSEVLSE